MQSGARGAVALNEPIRYSESRPPKRWLRPLLWSLLALVMLVLVSAGIGGWFAYRAYQPPQASTMHSSKVVVKSGESVAAIGATLQRAGLIRNAFIFRLYVRYKHEGSAIQAGTYAVAPGSRISTIVNQMTHGDVIVAAIPVTIPEGFTVQEIGDRLEAAGVCSKEAFLQQEQTGTFTEPFVAVLTNQTDVKYRLEGYLFPDTYAFHPNESPHDVVNTMLADFQKHIDAAHITEALKQQGETLQNLITTASMVEREAKIQHDRPLIASVIDNRLQQHMKLQIDATIQYILGHREIVTDKDLTVDDLYNTYLHYGLPPGPIGSPGMAAIAAALHPAKTNYLYYVAKYDGSGGSYFAATDAQHLKNIQKSDANLHAQGGQ